MQTKNLFILLLLSTLILLSPAVNAWPGLGQRLSRKVDSLHQMTFTKKDDAVVLGYRPEANYFVDLDFEKESQHEDMYSHDGRVDWGFDAGLKLKRDQDSTATIELLGSATNFNGVHYWALYSEGKQSINDNLDVEWTTRISQSLTNEAFRGFRATIEVEQSFGEELYIKPKLKYSERHSENAEADESIEVTTDIELEIGLKNESHEFSLMLSGLESEVSGALAASGSF